MKIYSWGMKVQWEGEEERASRFNCRATHDTRGRNNQTEYSRGLLNSVNLFAKQLLKEI